MGNAAQVAEVGRVLGELGSVALVLGVGLLMFLVERLAPGTRLPRVQSWWPRAIAFNGLQVGIVLAAGWAWQRAWGGVSLLDLSSWGTLGGGAAAYLLSTCVYYAWHRARHEVPLLWRWFHQLHHSPARLELITAFYKHPLEVLANAAISSATVYLLLGVTPAAGALYTALAGLAELFYHWNVRTPRWLGLVVQRPEMHRVHHERGRHASNYADLPLLDMLFGTYVNPARADAPCGFADDRELQVGAMLRGVDVEQAAATADVGASASAVRTPAGALAGPARQARRATRSF